MTDEDNELIENIKFLANCCKDEYNDIRIEAVLLGSLDIINRQKAEIERLQKINDSFTDIGKLYSEVKAEVVKEFAERLKKIIRLEDDCQYDCVNCYYECGDYVIDIDNLVKEMVGNTE